MFPIYLKEQEPFPPPPEPTYFLLAWDGVYLVKRSPLYEAVTKFDGALPGLAGQNPQLRLHIPKLPQRLVERIVGFFLDVFRRYGTEAMLLLFYSPADGFRVDVPPQRVSRWCIGSYHVGGYHVQYERCLRPKGYLHLGTVHSHGDLPAMHSCVDERDERYLDGLHITVGEVTAPRPSFSATFVASGHRFRLVPEDVLAGYAQPRLPAPAKWLAQIACHTYHAYGWVSDGNGQQRRWQDASASASGPAEACGA
jgi:hypothetical protein